MSRHVRIWSLLLVTGIGVLLLPQAGGAVTRNDCLNAAHRNVNTYTPTSNNNLTHWGTKAAHGISVPSADQNPVCGRASSIFSVTVGGDIAPEIGWFEDPKVTAPSCNYPSGGTQPRRLLALAIGSSFSCVDPANTPPIISAGWEPMNLHIANLNNCSVANSNGKMDYVDGGATIVEVTGLPMCTGISLTNGERHSYQGSDNAHSEFDGLNYYGSGGGWSPWEDQGWCFDNDPDYNAAIYSATHSEVIAQSGQTVSPACYS